MTTDGLIVGNDEKPRCWWPSDDAEYIRYHDEEWGMPVKDDIRLFEKICLEGFQAGLSWITILRKRDNFRVAFDGFDFNIVKNYTDADIERLVKDAGIIRHRGKIKSVINNANQVLKIIDEFGSFAIYIWQFEQPEETRPQKCDYETLSQITTSLESTALSKNLKKRGFSFVGPTTCYAFMQSMGMVNDHVEGCHCREKVENARRDFKRP